VSPSLTILFVCVSSLSGAIKAPESAVVVLPKSALKGSRFAMLRRRRAADNGIPSTLCLLCVWSHAREAGQPQVHDKGEGASCQKEGFSGVSEKRSRCHCLVLVTVKAWCDRRAARSSLCVGPGCVGWLAMSQRHPPRPAAPFLVSLCCLLISLVG